MRLKRYPACTVHSPRFFQISADADQCITKQQIQEWEQVQAHDEHHAPEAEEKLTPAYR